MYKNILIPYPQEIKDGGKSVKIAELTKAYFSIIAKNSGDVYDEALALLEDTLSGKTAAAKPYAGSYKITLKVEKFCDKKEAYSISITEDEAVLCGNDEAGAYYAVVTFEKLIYQNGNYVYLPVTEINDYPKFERRGVYVESRYNDFQSFETWKESVDYFAKMKMNTMIVGIYGTWRLQYDKKLSQYMFVPLKKYPEIKAPKHIKHFSAMENKWVYKEDVLPTMYTEDFFGDLILYAKKKNIDVIPLINSLGHNSLIPEKIPEISARDEDGTPRGFGMCLKNEKTYEVIFNIYDEIIDRYLRPGNIDGIAIGFDELQPSRGADKKDIKKPVSPYCQCEKCRNVEVGEQIAEYLINILKHLKKRGMKSVYVYYDMLLHYGLLTEEFAQRLKDADVFDVCVIDWWNYSVREKFFHGKGDQLNSLFRGIIKPYAGYESWLQYISTIESLKECAEAAERLNYEGIVAYCSFEYMFDYNFMYLAAAAWNKCDIENEDTFKQRYLNLNYPEYTDEAKRAFELYDHVADNYRPDKASHMGTFSHYLYSGINPDIPFPRDHIAEAFAKIFNEERKFIDYLNDVNLRSTEALKFYDSDHAPANKLNDSMRTNIYTHKVISDEFLTLYYLHKNYNSGVCDEIYFISELDRLIAQRKKLMFMTEKYRATHVQELSLRLMTIVLQYLIELKDRFTKDMANGVKPKFDVLNAADRSSTMFEFLR